MARRLIVDTGVLISSERGRSTLEHHLLPDDDVIIAAVTVAELRTGVELASPRHHAARLEFLLGVLQTIPVEPYGVAAAEAHGRLLAHVHSTGTKRGAHDLIIAATAVATQRAVLTTDQSARFEELPEVESVLIDPTD